jgi:hypothetical protein
MGRANVNIADAPETTKKKKAEGEKMEIDEVV